MMGHPAQCRTKNPRQLAERGRAELLVVHVTDMDTAPAEAGSLTTPRYVDQPQHEWVKPPPIWRPVALRPQLMQAINGNLPPALCLGYRYGASRNGKTGGPVCIRPLLGEE